MRGHGFAQIGESSDGRVLLIVGGLLLLAPGLTADVAGLALFGVAGASQLLRRARRPATAAA